MTRRQGPTTPRSIEDTADQLAAELQAAASPIVGLIGADVASTSAVLAGQLDDSVVGAGLSGRTSARIMCALWPHASPEDVGRADWWRTPLGRACARSLAADDVTVSQSVAAAMLGVTRGTIAQLVHRGSLARPSPGGGVSRSSVLSRLARG